ncbi:hypothetical protein [[Clostridium] colinum]|uniref:hypothetical protein n=1 Tax=[Clostridium] colinum TaxID=36835 RepID=UPI002024B0E2|nr:hypothetical protein [[Clostridium] colinum]
MEELKNDVLIGKYEDFYKNTLKEKILNVLKDITQNKDLSWDSTILNDFGKEVNVKEEIDEYVEVMSNELINDLASIDNKINEWFIDYEKIKYTNENTIVSDIKNSNCILNDIHTTKKELEKIEDNFINEIDENTNYNNSQKQQYKDVVKLLLENIKNVLNELAKQIELEIGILKYKFENLLKTEEKEKENLNQQFNLTDKDILVLAKNNETPISILKDLSKTEDIKVLRILALNKNLDNQTFIKLAKNSDLKLKELLLENENISVEALNILINDKDKFIKLEAIKHKNMSIEKLNEIYNKNIKDDEIIGCIAKNKNAPRELLEKISSNLKTTDENRKLAFKNKNHPINNVFEKPELSKEKSNELYQKLLLKTDIRKNNLLEMFKNKEMYADEKGNAIFPIKDSEEKIIGAYKLDFSKNEKPILLENSYAKKEYLEKVSNLANKIFESLQQEILEQVEEMEM